MASLMSPQICGQRCDRTLRHSTSPRLNSSGVVSLNNRCLMFKSPLRRLRDCRIRCDSNDYGSNRSSPESTGIQLYGQIER